MPLLHLPLELLSLVADFVGASELRKSVGYLLVAKRWYSAVLPVYLSQFPLSHLYLASHHDLERLPPPDSALSSLIQAKAKFLSVRLVGHPSKWPSVAPWREETDYNQLPWRRHHGMKKLNDWHDNWATAGPVRIVAGGQTRWHWHREGQMLEEWASCINEKLVGLGAMLSNSESLEGFSLEASSEKDGEKAHDGTIYMTPPFAV